MRRGAPALGRGCAAAALALAMVAHGPLVAAAQPVPAVAGAQADEMAEVAGALSSVVLASLDPPSERGLPRLSLDPSGDVTVSFAIRDIDDDPQAIRGGALSDTLSVLRGVYSSDEAGRVRTLTVLGTFPFKGTKSPSVHESPVLRAVLSAERAAGVDWAQVSPAGVPTVVDTWWLQGAFAEVGSADSAVSVAEAQPAADAQAGPVTGALDDLRAQLTVAGAHLDASRAALDAGQVGISRSQLLQFFDAWDNVDDTVARLDPAEYDTLDVELERAEVALLHSQPEDVVTAGSALAAIQAELASISSHLPQPATAR